MKIIVFKKYTSIADYLARFALFKVGRLSIRIHRIESEDNTPFLHTHPASYMTIVLKSKYVESYIDVFGDLKKRVVRWVHFRSSNTFHRIDRLTVPVLTLFISWERKDKKWNLITHDNVIAPKGYTCPYKKGVYERVVNRKKQYSYFDVYWRIGHMSVDAALKEKRPSIHQVCKEFIFVQ